METNMPVNSRVTESMSLNAEGLRSILVLVLVLVSIALRGV